MHIVLLIVLGGLMHATVSFAPQESLGSGPAATALACGYLLLSSFLAGHLFKQLGLPRLTGYLATGILVGPQALGLLSETVVADLRIFNGVAIALIALTAGTEMDLRNLRPLFRTVGWITLVAILGTVVLLATTVLVGQSLLPFMAQMSLLQAVAVALVLGVTMVAQSPAVVIALRDETEADGPLTRTILTVVVLADLVVIFLFAIVSSLARATLGADADVAGTAGLLAWDLLGSALVGLLVAVIVAFYFRKVPRGGSLFVVTVSFVTAEVGQRLHLDPLLVALVAGMLIRNLTDVAERLQAEINTASSPVYVAFFAVAGATIHLDALSTIGIPALALVGVRAAGLIGGTRMATRMAEAPEVVRRFAGFGLLPQAGLALALAILFSRAFPDFGHEAAALVFAVVAINELVAPVLLRMALVRSGEAGARAQAQVGAAEASTVTPKLLGAPQPPPLDEPAP